MATVKGVVENIITKTDQRGKEFNVVRVNGQGYFDWNGNVAKAQVKEGDTVEMNVGAGQYPRIYEIKKLQSSAPVQAALPNMTSVIDKRQCQIIRMAALKAAAELMQNEKLLSNPNWAEETIKIAKEFERWIKEGG